MLGVPLPVSSGPALGAAMLACSHAARARLRLSLHTAFGVFAASLSWPHWLPVAALALFSAAIAWSRLELSRHTPAEVHAEMLVGAVAGVAINALPA